MKNLDEFFMRKALALAQQAASENEVPVGALIVAGDTIVGKGYNQTIRLSDATAHAEMLAITAASSFVGSRYLNECTLYVTLEPCVMCAGAAYWTMLKRVVYGANDEKNGFSKHGKQVFHQKTNITSGVLETECKALLSDFFRNLRN